jgi:hypothetical protein
MELHQIGAHDTRYDIEDAVSHAILPENPSEDRAEFIVPKTEEMKEANEHAKHEYQ